MINCYIFSFCEVEYIVPGARKKMAIYLIRSDSCLLGELYLAQ